MLGRRAVGVELKESYYEQAIRNLQSLDEVEVNATAPDAVLPFE
jgi:hypothetical protein